MVPGVSPGVGDNWSGGRLEPGSSGTPAPPSTGIVDVPSPVMVVAGEFAPSLPHAAAITVNAIVAIATDRSCRAAVRGMEVGESAGSFGKVTAVLYPPANSRTPRTRQPRGGFRRSSV